MEEFKNQSHYANLKGLQPIEIIRNNFSADEIRGFFLGNMLKYILRYRLKDGMKDLRKAKVYLDWLIEHEEKNNAIEI